jgi:peroxiredoxin
VCDLLERLADKTQLQSETPIVSTTEAATPAVKMRGSRVRRYNPSERTISGAPPHAGKSRAPKRRVSPIAQKNSGCIVVSIFRSNQIDAALLTAYHSQYGETLAQLTAGRSVLLVFLRHFGCTFCREAVDEISKKRASIESRGAQLAFVHLGAEEKALAFFIPYGLETIPRFADPDGRLYETFGLARAELRQYLNQESILRMLVAWLNGHFVGLPAGDIKRMPGAFLIKDGEIRKAFRHTLVSDRPDYLALATAT